MEKQCGEWTITIDDTTGEYHIVNRGPNGERRYYEIIPGKYGEPIVVPEPYLAFEAPYCLTYVNAKGDAAMPMEKISGIICKGGHRLSLTNAKDKGIEIKPNNDGSILVGTETWWISTLFSKDKNRIRNYDAYCVREEPEHVRIMELGDLDLF